jgi:hypothetical protein
VLAASGDENAEKEEPAAEGVADTRRIVGIGCGGVSIGDGDGERARTVLLLIVFVFVLVDGRDDKAFRISSQNRIRKR